MTAEVQTWTMSPIECPLFPNSGSGITQYYKPCLSQILEFAFSLFRCAHLLLQDLDNVMEHSMNFVPIILSLQRWMSFWKILRKTYIFGQLTLNWSDTGVLNLEAEWIKCFIFGSMVWAIGLNIQCRFHPGKCYMWLSSWVYITINTYRLNC